MRIVDITKAKAHLSQLVELAAAGEPFVIAKAGKPMVRVAALDTQEPNRPKRIGFMAGRIHVPDDFNTMGGTDVEPLLGWL